MTKFHCRLISYKLSNFEGFVINDVRKGLANEEKKGGGKEEKRKEEK